MRTATLLTVLLLVACGGDEPGPGDGGADPSSEGPRPPALRGTVRAEDGRPIAGAVLHAKLPHSAGADGLRGIDSTSLEDGSFEILVEQRLSPIKDAPVYLTVRAEGYVQGSYRLPSFRPGVGQWLQITLAPAGSLTGRVVTADGGPIAGALVYLIKPEVPAVPQASQAITVRTGEDGAFRLQGVPAGPRDVGVLVDGFVPLVRGPVTIVAGEVTAAPELVAAAGGTVSGRVRTPEGKPVTGARIRAYGHAQWKEFELPGRVAVAEFGSAGRTDDEGRFTLTGLASGEYTVEARALGHHAVDAARPGVAPGTEAIDLVLAPDAWVQLLVIDADSGKPVPLFSVAIVPDGETPGNFEENEVSSPAGTFTFAARLRKSYHVEVVAEGYYDGSRDVGPVDGGKTLPVKILLLRKE